MALKGDKRLIDGEYAEATTDANIAQQLDRLSRLQDSRIANPAVTVIIAAFNVGPYLRQAAMTALNQTLRNLEVIIVDDHSTDLTLQVATDLAEEDNRVRVLRTRTNSGGPGVPRNIGIQNANAPYYTFLDGDDTLELHACKTLLEYAETTNSDVVTGRTQRFHIRNGKFTAWYGGLYVDLREGIEPAELPEILNDSIAAGKLYRKNYTVSRNIWLLEGVHFEDLIFTARAFAEADTITVVPATTYYWHVYPSDERQSITQQNDTLKNLEDRLNALQLVDEALEHTHKDELIKQAKRKFLRHDAMIYMKQSLVATDEWLDGACKLLQPRLESMAPDDWDLIDIYAHWIYGSALSRNLTGIRQAVLFLKDRGMLSGQQVEQDNHIYWQPGATQPSLPPASSTAARLLDMTNSPVLDMPINSIRPRTAVTGIKSEDKYTRVIHGETDDLLGKLEQAEIFLRINIAGYPRYYDIQEMAHNRQSNGTIRWTAKLTLPDTLPVIRPMRLQLSLHFKLPNDEIRVPIRVGQSMLDGIGPLAQPGNKAESAARRFKFIITENQHLQLKPTKARGKRGKADILISRATKVLHELNNNLKPTLDRQLILNAYPAMRHLPIQRNAVFCESMLGKSAWDSPRYIAEELTQRDPDLCVYWTYSGTVPPKLPDRFIPVKRWSREYLLRAATSKFIIDNQSLPEFFKKRAEQIYLQTWHGIPLKRMGLNSPEIRFQPPEAQQALIDRGNQWTALVCPNDYFKQTFVSSYRYRGDLIGPGTPRNDVLINKRDQSSDFKQKLGLPIDRTICLYAPTFRSTGKYQHPVKPGEMFDLHTWCESLGNRFFLVIQAHYLDRMAVPRSLSPHVISAPNHWNINDLYLASDMLITDYSSVMFDYSLLDKPIALYTYDYEQYANEERGLYFDLQSEGPSDPLYDFQSLISAVPAIANSDPITDQKYQRFKHKFAGIEDGTAAARASQYLLDLAASK